MKQLGAIGVDAEGRSIFPDWETGDKAMKSLLKKGNAYVGKDIRGVIEAFAPPNENNTEAYIKYVTEKSGLPENKKIGDMTDAEFQRVTDAMKEVEDSTPGYDLVNFGTVANPDWQKIGYMEIGKDGSSKDFSHYGPMIMQKHRGMIEYHLVPVPGAASDHHDSGKTHSADSGGGDHGTLERRGENIYRIDPDGKRRGFFPQRVISPRYCFPPLFLVGLARGRGSKNTPDCEVLSGFSRGMNHETCNSFGF